MFEAVVQTGWLLSKVWSKACSLLDSVDIWDVSVRSVLARGDTVLVAGLPTIIIISCLLQEGVHNIYLSLQWQQLFTWSLICRPGWGRLDVWKSGCRPCLQNVGEAHSQVDLQILNTALGEWKLCKGSLSPSSLSWALWEPSTGRWEAKSSFQDRTGILLFGASRTGRKRDASTLVLLLLLLSLKDLPLLQALFRWISHYHALLDIIWLAEPRGSYLGLWFWTAIGSSWRHSLLWIACSVGWSPNFCARTSLREDRATHQAKLQTWK